MSAALRCSLAKTVNGTLISGPAVIEDSATRILAYTLGPEDFDVAGVYRAEWRVTFNDNTVSTFPTVDDGYEFFKILPRVAVDVA